MKKTRRITSDQKRLLPLLVGLTEWEHKFIFDAIDFQDNKYGQLSRKQYNKVLQIFKTRLSNEESTITFTRDTECKDN